MKFFKFLFLAALLASSSIAAQVNVFAAANTTYAFNELIAAFKQISPNTKINLSLASSGVLSTQIKNGAKADIFMAANMDFVQDLYKAGFGAQEPQIYAKGKLALFSIRLDLKDGLNSLKKAKTISIANPKTAPYGAASIEALKNAGLYDELRANIVWAGKISETLSQALSAADAGFIAASALFSPKMQDYKESKQYIFVPSQLYKPIAQGMLLLKQGENNKVARAFYEFILGKQAKEIFAKFGYDVQ